MKILYLVHQFYPMHYTGTEKFVLNLATSMQKWGHKVKVLTYSFYDDPFYTKERDGFLSREFFYKGLPVYAVKQKQAPLDINYGIENRPFASRAERILSEEKPNIIHIGHGMRLSEFAMAAQRCAIPYIITMTDFFFMCPKCILFTSKGALCAGPEKGEACKKLCPEFGNEYIQHRLMLGEDILRGAARVVAPSKFLASLFKNEFPWLQPEVVPYGIDFRWIKRNTRVYNGSDKLIILYAGQIDYHKGVHVLIEAVKRIKSNNFLLKLYGSGPITNEKQLRDMAKSDPRIQFCGVYSEDQIGNVFSAVDLVIIPSNWHENNTIVMREAFASHIPVVVSNAGGMVEMVQEGVNGFIFRMGDVNHLKEVLERITNQSELLNSMKENLQSYAVTTVEQEAYAYEKEYISIVSEK